MPSVKYPAIPEPNASVESLRAAVIALKQAVEVLGRMRGGGMDSAVTFDDLVTLGLIEAVDADKVLG